MNKSKTIVFGSLVAGSLIASAGPALARVEWRDIVNDPDRPVVYIAAPRTLTNSFTAMACCHHLISA